MKFLGTETVICLPGHNIKEHKLIKMQVYHQMWPESENKAVIHKIFSKVKGLVCSGSSIH